MSSVKDSEALSAQVALSIHVKYSIIFVDFSRNRADDFSQLCDSALLRSSNRRYICVYRWIRQLLTTVLVLYSLWVVNAECVWISLFCFFGNLGCVIVCAVRLAFFSGSLCNLRTDLFPCKQIVLLGGPALFTKLSRVLFKTVSFNSILCMQCLCSALYYSMLTWCHILVHCEGNIFCSPVWLCLLLCFW